MRKLNILFIEHSTNRTELKYCMEQAGADVVLIDKPDLEKIKEKLNEKYFDIIITDAYFLPPNVDHLAPGENKETFELENIIRTIRTIEKRAKILVFSEFNDLILSHKETLEGADYILDKSSTTLSLLKWQIERFRDSELYKNFHEHALIISLFILFNEDRIFIWKSELMKMLEEYRNGINETEQIQSIQASLTQIASSLKCTLQFNELFDAIKNQEVYLIATSPLKWGHLRHVINVYWLGYYLINSGLINIADVCKLLFPTHTSLQLEKQQEMLNQAWLIAAIFHDIGYLGQNLGGMLSQIKEMIKIYPENSCDWDFSDKTKLISDEVFQTYMCGPNDYFIRLFKKNNKLPNDHGLISAWTIYKKFDHFDESFKAVLIPAIQAVGFHNILQKKDQIEEFTNLNNYPLITLLTLCDQIEVWDRNTGFESFFTDFSLEKIELQEFWKDQTSINIVINYSMHKAIMPNETSVKKSIIGITRLLGDSAIPLLNKVSECKIIPKLKVKFILNNRDILLVWP